MIGYMKNQWSIAFECLTSSRIVSLQAEAGPPKSMPATPELAMTG